MKVMQKIEKEIFIILLEKIKRLSGGKHIIYLNGVMSLDFRYATVGDGDDTIRFACLAEEVDNERVSEMVFDVKGMDIIYLTQVAFTREEEGFEVYFVPERPVEKINKFLEEIKKLGEKR